jgi:hypothetical protein
MQEVSEIANGYGADQAAISQPHDNHCHFDHVIHLVLRPNHSGHLKLNSVPQIAEVGAVLRLHPSMEALDYP